jgi:hypothetical protein
VRAFAARIGTTFEAVGKLATYRSLDAADELFGRHLDLSPALSFANFMSAENGD